MTRTAKAKRKPARSIATVKLERPESERAALQAMLIEIDQRPAEVAKIADGLDPLMFADPLNREIMHAIKAALEADRPGIVEVGAAIRRQADAVGCDHHDAVALVADLLNTWVGGDGIYAGTLASVEITQAHDDRQKADAALDTLHSCGLLPAVTDAVATTAKPPPTKLRGLPVVRVENANRADVTDQAEQLLAAEFFVRDGRLVTIADGLLGPMIAAVTKERVADRLERLCAFYEPAQDATGNWIHRPIPCPGWLPLQMVGKQVWPAMRPLRGIARGPYLRPDGTIGGTASGYDPSTRLMVVTGDEWAGLDADPTGEDVAAAVSDLADLLKDFPFEDGTADVGLAVWVSALLTLVARPAFEGPSPLFLFDATTAGSGKTLLAKLLGVIANGYEPALAGMPASAVELKKAITAGLLMGSPLHVFDNCAGTIGNDVLDMLLTSTNYQDRRLGTNETVIAEARMLLVATSNNAAIGADTARRTLTLRLRPTVDRPEEQEFDRDLVAYATENRVRLMGAALAILRWHFMQGAAPLPKARQFGSFNGWSAAVRMAVIRAGLADPLESQAMVRRIDDGSRMRHALIEAWAGWRPGFRGTARKLVADLFEGDGEFVDQSDEAERFRAVVMDLTNCTAKRPGPQEARRLGYVIRGMRGRVFGGWSIDPDGHAKDGNSWALSGPPGWVAEDEPAEIAFGGFPR